MKRKDNYLSLDLNQPTLFDFSEISSESLELFPAVWSALEDLAAPQTERRFAAVERLVDLDAPRLSPLVAYMLATRLADPDLGVRKGVIKALGKIFSPDQKGLAVSTGVNSHVSSYLAQMRTRPIFALLEAVDDSLELTADVARLLNACPYSGNHLADILADRKKPLNIRKQAAVFIGLVGFLDALPTLERMEVRLVSRLSGQQPMPFAPQEINTETELLPLIQEAVRVLKSA